MCLVSHILIMPSLSSMQLSGPQNVHGRFVRGMQQLQTGWISMQLKEAPGKGGVTEASTGGGSRPGPG